MAEYAIIGNVVTMPGCSFSADAVDAAEVINSGWLFDNVCFLQITLDSGAKIKTAHVTRDCAYRLLVAVAQVMKDTED